MRRHEFSSAQWELIADLMPQTASHGGSRLRDHRQFLMCGQYHVRASRSA